MNVLLERVGSELELQRKPSVLSIGRIVSNCSVTRIFNGAALNLGSRVYSYLSLGRLLSQLILEGVDNVITPAYLEIEPELIWVYTDTYSNNNVYSNTDWNID